MRTVIVAAGSMLGGAVVGYLLAGATVQYLRRKVRTLRSTEQEKPSKIGVMDKVLIFEAIVLIAYIVADMVVFWHVGSEPYTLTGCVFGVCGLENGVMGWIKTNKDKAADAARDTKDIASVGLEPERPEPPDVGL